MPPAERIVILQTAGAVRHRAHFVVHAMAEEWRRRGLSVEITERLEAPTGPEVLVFPHLDVTVVPPSHAEVLTRCARVINRRVTDISKRVISRHLVASPTDYDGPVIVKTNLNFGGLPEMVQLRRLGNQGQRLIAKLQSQHWTVSGVLHSYHYQVYDRPDLVPPAVWSNPRLIVERFLPERDGELYGIRQCVFFGDQELNTRVWSAEPLVKSRNVVRRDVLDRMPPAVQAFRAKLGFDYGKFDYVSHGDECFVFDANRTPSYQPNSKAGSVEETIRKLASGIEPFLGRS